MKDRFESRRNNRTLGVALGPAQLILFPLCDSRGLITRSLTGAVPNADDHEAENAFFAWLLDLPAEIDAAAAARAMLLVSGVAVDDSGDRESSSIPVVKGKFRRTIVGLLQRVITRDSLYDSPPKSPLDEMQQEMPPT